MQVNAMSLNCVDLANPAGVPVTGRRLLPGWNAAGPYFCNNQNFGDQLTANTIYPLPPPGAVDTLGNNARWVTMWCKGARITGSVTVANGASNVLGTPRPGFLDGDVAAYKVGLIQVIRTPCV